MKKKNKRQGCRYTKAEIDYISEKFGIIKTETIAKKLGRSKQAIEKKALQLYGTANGNSVQGLYNSEEISIMLGVWKGAVADWVHNRGLPVVNRSGRKVENESSLRTEKFSIDLEVFFEWLKENKNNVKIDFNKVKIGEIPFVPDWFKGDYENKNHYHVGNRVEWSQEETETLLQLFYNESKTLREVAEVLDRTYVSVRKKKQQLNEKKIYAH